jgi:hypothetical protein
MKMTMFQIVTDDFPVCERDRLRNLRDTLSEQLLKTHNTLFHGTAGVSRNNGALGFVPAFLDLRTGRAEISRFADGRPAAMHIIDGLPDEWVAQRDADGRVLNTHPGIVAGFLRDERFYTRKQAAQAASH